MGGAISSLMKMSFFFHVELFIYFKYDIPIYYVKEPTDGNRLGIEKRFQLIWLYENVFQFHIVFFMLHSMNNVIVSSTPSYSYFLGKTEVHLFRRSILYL